MLPRLLFALGFQDAFRYKIDMKPMESHIPWSYLSNELSCLKKDQGVTKIHLSQGKHINWISGAFPKEKLTLDFGHL